MAKGAREKIKLESTAGTGHFYTTTKNKKTTPDKLQFTQVRPGGAQARRVQRNQAEVVVAPTNEKARHCRAFLLGESDAMPAHADNCAF